LGEKRRKVGKEDKEEHNDKNGKVKFDKPPGIFFSFLKSMKNIYLKS
jgi:hypothetical protein